MFVFDRLYGKLTFPPLIQRVLSCPGLLRLREVRMANIPFLAFPAFAATTRYEHSLGVCHLAGIFAKQASLSEKDKIEVMLAALYHDVATPPFAHAVEEVLAILYGFDHEEKLRQLIVGQTEDLGKHRAQLFLGHSLRLHSVCQTKEARRLGIDIFRIADLAAGSPNDPLGNLICSDDIDLDNIDNVFRAATAMGVYHSSRCVAENLARSFIFDGARLCLDEGGITFIKEWQRVRELLYGMIYASIQDFAQQTMLKHALQHLARSSTDNKLQESDWCLTDDELIHQRLLREPATAEIVRRMRLGNVYTCLAFLSVEGQKSVRVITLHLNRIERTAADCFRDFLVRERGKKGNPGVEGPSVKIPAIVANVYPDKRHRSIRRPLLFMGHERQLEDSTSPFPKVFLGIFTPHHRKWDATAQKLFIERLQSSFSDLRVTNARINRGQRLNLDGGRAE